MLGGSCARVCPYDRLCEEACSRFGIDRPIEIGKLQRYAIEQEKLFGMKTLTAPDNKLRERFLYRSRSGFAGVCSRAGKERIQDDCISRGRLKPAGC